MDIWKSFPLEQDTCYQWQIGVLQIFILHSGDEWEVGFKRGEESPDEGSGAGIPTERPDDAEWRRWVTGISGNTAVFSPRMPDKPVVVRPEKPLTIAAGAKAGFAVEIPLWVHISAGADTGIPLFEEPVSVLSNTWFGDPTSGELCYSLANEAFRTQDTAAGEIHRAVCPLHIINKSNSELDFERVCIQAPFLSIYRGSQGLVTSELQVSYKGDDQKSRIKIGSDAPSAAKDASLVSGPREILKDTLIRKSFSRIASYTGF